VERWFIDRVVLLVVIINSCVVVVLMVVELRCVIASSQQPPAPQSIRLTFVTAFAAFYSREYPGSIRR
jgi:hypothetical protein